MTETFGCGNLSHLLVLPLVQRLSRSCKYRAVLDLAAEVVRFLKTVAYVMTIFSLKMTFSIGFSLIVIFLF